MHYIDVLAVAKSAVSDGAVGLRVTRADLESGFEREAHAVYTQAVTA